MNFKLNELHSQILKLRNEEYKLLRNMEHEFGYADSAVIAQRARATQMDKVIEEINKVC